MSAGLASTLPLPRMTTKRMTDFRCGLNDYLIGAGAAAGETLTYEQVAREFIADAPPNYLAQHLDAISWHHFVHGRPLLSAIVVYKYTNNVGPGFWIMVEREMRTPVADKAQFLANMQRSVFAYWRLS